MYTPMSGSEFDRRTSNLSLYDLKRFVRSERQGESDTLNHAMKQEIRSAMLSGEPIAEIVYDRRLPLAKQHGTDYTGMGALKNAAKVLCKDLPEALEGSGGDPSPGEPEPKSDSDDLAAVRAALGINESPEIDEDAVRKIAAGTAAEVAARIAAKVATSSIEVTIPDAPEPIVIEGVHSQFPEALRIASVHQRVLLHGPKGSGKSTIAQGISEAMGYNANLFRIVSCTAESSIYDLLGARDAEGKFHSGMVLDAFEGDMLLFLDEFDALDPSTGVSLNAVLDDGGVASVPQRSENPTAYRSERFLPVVAVNTLHGSTSSYTGRMKQDAATMSRFPELVRVFVDYDRKIEAAILSGSPALAERLWDLRDKTRNMNLDEARVITTRDFVAAAKEVAAREAGWDGALSDNEIMDRTIAGWTTEEKYKVGV